MVAASIMTKIPISRLSEDEQSKYAAMSERLHERIIGQDEAIEKIAKAVRRSRAGLKDPKRPVGSFIFLGPTGVGKTELTKALAKFMFGSEDALIQLDMSEFMERHNVARLIGSPPGYVGFDQGGKLTEAVRRKPYSVILLDEIEKADIDVFNVLLQLLDEGRLTDGQGRTVDFRNTVLIMTSNIASDQILKMAEDAESDKGISLHVKDALKAYFKPEFLNRIDEILVFHMLTKEHLADIVRVQVAERKGEHAAAVLGAVRVDVAARYRETSGSEIDDLHWFRTYAAYRHAAIMVRVIDRQIHFGDTEAAEDPEEAILHRNRLREMIAT